MFHASRFNGRESGLGLWLEGSGPGLWAQFWAFEKTPGLKGLGVGVAISATNTSIQQFIGEWMINNG